MALLFSQKNNVDVNLIIIISYEMDVWFYSINFFLILLSLVAFILFTLNYVVVYQQVYLEKISAYECGFQPFEYSINDFDIRYYLIAILFLIFDLELIFLFPFLINLDFIGISGYLAIFLFLFLLFIGFYYEWLRKGLEWD